MKTTAQSPAKTPRDTPRGERLKVDDLLLELERFAKAAQVRVSYEAIGGELGAGGLCRVKGEWRVIIDKRAVPSERASVLSGALSRLPAERLTQVREALEGEGKPLAKEAVELLGRTRLSPSGIAPAAAMAV